MTHQNAPFSLSAEVASRDPRDVFLTAEEVHARYGLSRTKGYELTGGSLATLAFVPGRWRLADLHALEEARRNAVLATLLAAGDDSNAPQPVNPLVPYTRSAAEGRLSSITPANGSKDTKATTETDDPPALPAARRGGRRKAA